MARLGVYTPEMYRGIIGSDGREGANGVGDGNGHGSGVGGSNADVNGDEDGAGTGTGKGVETQGRTPNEDRNGSGDRNERRSGDGIGNGGGDGTEDGIGEGGGEVKKHKKPLRSYRREVGNKGIIGGTIKNVDKKGLVQ